VQGDNPLLVTILAYCLTLWAIHTVAASFWWYCTWNWDFLI